MNYVIGEIDKYENCSNFHSFHILQISCNSVEIDINILYIFKDIISHDDAHMTFSQ